MAIAGQQAFANDVLVGLRVLCVTWALVTGSMTGH